MKTRSLTPDAFTEWVTSRESSAWGQRGIASLLTTAWLGEDPIRVDHAPGIWTAVSGAAVGAEVVATGEIRLEPGSELNVGSVRLVAFGRDGEIALRVFRSEATGDTAGRITRHKHRADAVIEGRYTPGAVGPRPTVAVDGHRATATYSGVIEFEFEGESLQLLVVDEGPTLFAAFSDAQSAARSPGFRMIRIAAPGEDGLVAVDLNRAYLPPSAFSRHYVCATPPPENRWSVPVDAGEIAVVATA